MVAKLALLLVVFILRFEKRIKVIITLLLYRELVNPCLLGSNPIGGAFLGGSLGGGAR